MRFSYCVFLKEVFGNLREGMEKFTRSVDFGIIDACLGGIPERRGSLLERTLKGRRNMNIKNYIGRN